MTFIPYLAAEGFALNFNPLQTNLINLAIVIGVLVWFLRGFLGGILERRRSVILQDLQDAETRLKQATADLATAQSDLAAAQQKADKIRAAAIDVIAEDGFVVCSEKKKPGDNRQQQSICKLREKNNGYGSCAGCSDNGADQ